MKFILVLLLLLIPLQSVSAGYVSNSSVSAGKDAENADPEPDRDIWLGIWTAYSPISVPLLATMRNARFAMLGFDLRYASYQIGEQKINFSGELIMLGRTAYPVNGISGPKASRMGMGLLPLRLTLPFYSHSSGNYLHLETGTGLLLFDKPYPNRHGTLLNVIVDVGIGYNISVTETTSISIGYRLQHISNGGSGQVNPGIDSNLFIFSLRSSI